MSTTRSVRLLATVNLALLVIFICNGALRASEGDWVRPAKPGDALIWGRRDGIIFGLPSEGGLPGPRGLIRVGVLSPSAGRPELLNFIAIEPVVSGPGDRFGRMAFSELEPSVMDAGQNGKRLWIGKSASGKVQVGGELTSFAGRHDSAETISVQIEVEPFTANKAHVYLLASIESDHPAELRLTVYAREDSPPLDELTVTATMGNYERLRFLWLKHHIVISRKLYASYTGDAFIEQESYPLDEMLRTAGGDAIVFGTSDETDPRISQNPHAKSFWHYQLPKLTQYWRVPTHDIQPDLRVRVNGRRVYWASHDPLPNGIAFENFELRQRYVAGQSFVFGVTAEDPDHIRPEIPHLSVVQRTGPSRAMTKRHTSFLSCLLAASFSPFCLLGQDR